MQRRYILIGLTLAALLAFVGVAYWSGGPWDHTSVTRVVPGANGETLVITDNGGPGFFPFFPFFPFFLFIPVLWFLVIGCVFTLLGRARGANSRACGPGFAHRQAWLEEWHRQQHEPNSGSVSEQVGGGETLSAP